MYKRKKTSMKNGGTRKTTFEAYQQSVALTRRRLQSLRMQRTNAVERLQAIAEEIRLAKGIVELWDRFSNGKANRSPRPRRSSGNEQTTNRSRIVDWEARRPMRARPLYRCLRDVLQDGEPRHLDQIRTVLTSRLDRPVPRTTVRSALLRYADTFERSGPNEFRGILAEKQNGAQNGA